VNKINQDIKAHEEKKISNCLQSNIRDLTNEQKESELLIKGHVFQLAGVIEMSWEHLHGQHC